MNRSCRVSCLLTFFLSLVTGSLPAQFAHFITRQGDHLMDGDNVFRFISYNTPNLHYVEDYLPFQGTNPWRLPDDFEIRDALKTIRQMGGKVTRMYVLSVRRADDTPDIRRHIDGPGLFNVDAFATLDTVLAEANSVGVRVIIPFVDNWKWWGGVAEYAAFRGKEREAFWTDPQLIHDFEATIEFLINRTNTVTGIRYKDDKAILAWETGNELVAPFSWTKQVAAFIRSLDTNHLVMEGTLAKELTQDALDDPDIDILSSHHYGDPKASVRFITHNREMSRGKKPYVVGEYGIVPTADITAMTDTIIRQGIAGGMLWSLRFRTREGGFYHHYEYNNVSSYRWPGFFNGSTYDEQQVMTMMRAKAYAIDGRNAPPVPVPETPYLLPIAEASSISWQGSVGATSYSVERCDADSALWAVVAPHVDESSYQYRPLYSDDGAATGRSYYYRVRSQNASGTSGYSNVVGPVKVAKETLVDEMESLDKVYQKSGDLRLLTFEDIRKAKEDRSRLAGSKGSSIVYKIPTGTTHIRVDAFKTSGSGSLRIEADSSLQNFRVLPTRAVVYSFGSNDYGFFDAASYMCESVPPWTRFVRIELGNDIQISRVEISTEATK